MRNLLIAQSGGPSAAINATVAGIVERCITSCKVDRVLGAINGIKGVLAGNFVDLTEKLDSAEKLDLLCPGENYIETIRRKGYRFRSEKQA